MPIRTFAILAGLLGATIAVAVIVWLTGGEVYVLLPGRGVHRPPTEPLILLALLGSVFVVGAISRHYALYAFLLLTGAICLGTIVGPVAFEWTPTPSQVLLLLSSLATAGYGWMNQDYLD